MMAEKEKQETTKPFILTVDNAHYLEWAISLNRSMLQIIGLWPPDIRKEHETLRPKLRLLYNLLTLLFILTIPILMSLIRIWGDMILMVDNMIYSLPMSITVFKVCILWYKQKDLLPLVDMIARDWLKYKMKEERDVMLKVAKITRMLTMCAWFVVMCTIVITCVFPCFGLTTRHVNNLTDPGKQLPLQTYYLHDVSKSPQFELTFLAQAIAMLTSGISYSGIDNFLGLLVLHICGQLENLQFRLAHMENHGNYDAILKYNVQDHIRLIRSIKIIDDTFHLILLLLVLGFGITFCIQGFLILNIVSTEKELSFMQLCWYVTMTICITLHMCLYCAAGEILVIQCEKIYRATYEYAWYLMDPRSAKNLLLIMLRAHKPLHITAGKTFPMTMATFCNLLKTSAGYISVLLANQD